MAAHTVAPATAWAQQPAGPVPFAPYRAPLIALVQPAMSNGAGTVPQDRPVVVFRFAAGEADDPLDVRSFVVAVDGVDRSALFQVTASQAWGPLASADQLARGELPPGAHRVVARICSSRGACADAEAQLLLLPGPVAPNDDAGSEPGKRGRAQRVIDAVLSATRKLLLPATAAARGEYRLDARVPGSARLPIAFITGITP